jgi:hypothetical protein
MDHDFDLEGEFSEPNPGEREVEDIAEDISELDPLWQRDTSISLGQDRIWRPDLVRADNSALLHVHVADHLRTYAIKRFEWAVEAGVEVHVATTLNRLYDPTLLKQLAAADALVHVINGSTDLAKGERLLGVLADEEIRVPASLRTELARYGLEFSAADGSSHQKGRRFEALVAFLLSQVDGLSIFSRNYKTETEEIDVVLQQHSLSGPVWAIANAPFILVEAKNHADGISQAMFSQFRIKMQTKRASVRIGLMLSRTSVSGDATQQEERFSSDTLTVAFIDGETLEQWIEAEDGTAFLERIIAEAMLG